MNIKHIKGVWVGKLVGAAWGFANGGVLGAMVGALVGHVVDKAVAKARNSKPASTPEKQQRDQFQRQFFRATFLFMGRLAKADGRVSEQEISAATKVMDQMGMSSAQRQEAIRYFSEGKNPSEHIERDLLFLRERGDMAQFFLEIQLTVAYADGKLSLEERKLFDRVCKMLGISPFQFEWINSRIQALVLGATASPQQEKASAQQSYAKSHWGGQSTHSKQRNQSHFRTPTTDPQVRHAYAVLGVSEQINDDELKKTYRKLMSQHHPDKLMAKGLPEEMMRLAKEKTQQIQTAYDVVSKARRNAVNKVI